MVHLFHKWQWHREYDVTEYIDPTNSLGGTYKQFYHRFVCHCGAIKSVMEKGKE